jgi:hypothetical protein
MAVQTKVVLEPAAQELADAFSAPPFLYELDYPAARKVLDDAQATPIEKLPVDEEWNHCAFAVRRRPRADHQTTGRRRRPSGDLVHARRWLGAG